MYCQIIQLFFDKYERNVLKINVVTIYICYLKTIDNIYNINYVHF